MNETDLPKTTLKRYVLAAIFGTIGGLLTIGTIFVLDSLIHLIWVNIFGLNPDAPTRNYASFGMLLLAGLIIGLISKKFGKVEGNIETIIEDSLNKGGINWRPAIKDLLVSVISIGSGASLGPEAPSAVLSAGTAAFIGEKAKVNQETQKAMSLGAVSGMLGSLLSSPFLAGTMFIESSKKQIKDLRSELGYGMIASAFGMAVFFGLFGKLYSFDLGIPSYAGPNFRGLLVAFTLGLIGAIFGVIVGLIIKALSPIFTKLENRYIAKALFGAAIAGAIALIAPLTMFSGQHTLPDLINSAATMSFFALILIGFGKILATSVLLRTGFFGGSIFPAIFAGAAIGLAFNQIFDAPVTLAISSAIAGLMTISTRQPLTAAFITLVIAGSTNAAPVALAVSAGLIIVAAVEQLQAKKQ